MKVTALRHKHVQLDQRKLDRARRVLGAGTETETLNRALDLVVTEAEVDRALRAARSTARARRGGGVRPNRSHLGPVRHRLRGRGACLASAPGVTRVPGGGLLLASE